MPIRVLIVDDSAAMRGLLAQMIRSDPGLAVVGEAPDPLAAREMIKALNPDVLTLDVEMPRMDGLDFLGRLMRLRPMPVVMVSSHTGRGSEVALRALEAGAVDVVAKPHGPAGDYGAWRDAICDSIRGAYEARHQVGTPGATAAPAAPAMPALARPWAPPGALILIGASTGGTEAIRAVLQGLPLGLPPVVMVQHMPEMFTASFAKRLDSVSALTVSEAVDGERLQSGHAYLAPGDQHLRVRRDAGGWRAEVYQGEKVSRHRPSVDVLFHSAALLRPRDSVAVLLTGMGRDGAEGMAALRQTGVHTVAQDEASCVVFGMPKVAIELGAAAEVAPLDQIAACVLRRYTGADAGRPKERRIS